jgi:hypothetical protein
VNASTSRQIMGGTKTVASLVASMMVVHFQASFEGRWSPSQRKAAEHLGDSGDGGRAEERGNERAVSHSLNLCGPVWFPRSPSYDHVRTLIEMERLCSPKLVPPERPKILPRNS